MKNWLNYDIELNSIITLKIKSNYESEETFFQNAFEKWSKTDEAKTFFEEYLENH